MVNVDGTVTYRSNVEVRSDIGAAASSHQHNANDINAGILGVDRIPNLDTSKINSGQFTFDRMPRAGSGFLKATGIGSNPTYALLIANDIPNLDTSKVTTGRFEVDRMPAIPNNQFMVGTGGNPTFRELIASDIPSLDTSKITTGIFSVDRIPNLDTSKIDTGRFVLDRMPVGTRGVLKAAGPSNSPYYELLTSGDIPNINAEKITSGVLGVDRIPNINASKITDGVLPVLRGGTGSNNAGNFLKDRDVNASDFNSLTLNGYYNARSSQYENNPFANDPTPGILLSLGIESNHQMYLHQDGGLSVRGGGGTWSPWRRMYTDDYHPKITEKFNTYIHEKITSKYYNSPMNITDVELHLVRFGNLVFIQGLFQCNLRTGSTGTIMFRMPTSIGTPIFQAQLIIHSGGAGTSHEGGEAFINVGQNDILYRFGATVSDRYYIISGMFIASTNSNKW